MTDTAPPSIPNYDRVFPTLTVTPGLQASCLASSAWPDVALSVSQTFNGKVISSSHELSAALSAGSAQGAARANTTHSARLMSSLGSSRPLRSKEELFPCLVPGDLKAILRTSAQIARNMVGTDGWKENVLCIK